VLGRNAEGALTAIRTPEPGELYRYHLGRLAWTDQLVADHGVRRAPCAADLEAAHNTGQPAIIADVEGLDFLEMKLERLEEARQRGIRHVQLVHYTPNDIGDFQTGAITHRGLSEFGAEVIRACQRMGGCGLTARRRASTGYNSSRPIRCTKIRAARAEGRPFQNPLEPRTLEWRS